MVSSAILTNIYFLFALDLTSSDSYLGFALQLFQRRPNKVIYFAMSTSSFWCASWHLHEKFLVSVKKPQPGLVRSTLFTEQCLFNSVKAECHIFLLWKGSIFKNICYKSSGRGSFTLIAPKNTKISLTKRGWLAALNCSTWLNFKHKFAFPKRRAKTMGAWINQQID